MDQYSQLRRFGLLDGNLPRYTSYPPAPRFKNNARAQEYKAWVGALPPDTNVAVYVHIPFCKRLCWFCSARTQSAPGGAPVSAYVDTLIAEFNTLRAILPQGVRVKRVLWGGGTPTILTPVDIKRLSSALYTTLPLADSPEITVEIDPNELDDARMDALMAMGMTMASIGIQDFDADIQKVIGRDLSFETTKAAVDGLRARGLQTLSMGLLYGLPQQTRSHVTLSTQMMLSLSPDRITVEPYAHVPSVARRQSLIPTADIPPPEEQLDLFNTVRQVLTWDGYDPVGIDHFALPTDRLAKAAKNHTLRRSFEGYTDNTSDVLLGFGASAISRLPQGYVQNVSSTAAYLKAIASNGQAIMRGHRKQGEDALRGRMIEMILCDFRIDMVRLTGEGLGKGDLIMDLLAQLVRRFPDEVVLVPEGVFIPAHAKVYARAIARALDTYSDPMAEKQAVGDS